MTDDERVAGLRRDGAVAVPSLLDDVSCARLRTAIERCRAAPGRHHGVLSPAGMPVVESDLFRWRDDPDLHDITHCSPIVELAATMLGVDDIVLIEDQWFYSAAGASTPSPWHQDEPYYHLDRPFLTIWATLDDVDEDASLRFVPGSHRTGITYEMVEFAATARSTIDRAGASTATRHVPDVEADPIAHGVRSWPLRAGDAIVLDSRTLHATGTGQVPGPFRRLSTRWAHPETRYCRRPGGGASFWGMLEHGLRDGDLIAGEVFPVIPIPERTP